MVFASPRPNQDQPTAVQHNRGSRPLTSSKTCPLRLGHAPCYTEGMKPRLAGGFLLGTAAAATLAFAAISYAVAQGHTRAFDRRAKRRVHSVRDSGLDGSLRLASTATTPLGKWWGFLPPVLVTAAKLGRSRRRAAAITVASAAFGAAALPPLLDRAVRRRSPPPERHEPSKQSYPSGHALRSSALAIAVGYVMNRERLAPPSWLMPLGSLSVAAGVGRLLLDRHWTSDVLGGYCAGIALGSACAGVYELSRGQ